MREREWLGSPMQRLGSLVLSIIEPKYLGPTEASYEPCPTPWLFRGNNDQIALVVICLIVLVLIWA